MTACLDLEEVQSSLHMLRWKWCTLCCPCWGPMIKMTCLAPFWPCRALRTVALPCANPGACRCSSSFSMATTRTLCCLEILVAAKRPGRGPAPPCITLSIHSPMTSGAGGRSGCSTCWSRSELIARPAGSGRKAMSVVWTKTRTQVSPNISYADICKVIGIALRDVKMVSSWYHF